VFIRIQYLWLIKKEKQWQSRKLKKSADEIQVGIPDITQRGCSIGIGTQQTLPT